jgi:hypothetical protein
MDAKAADMILIDWIDSAGSAGWKLPEECCGELSKCQSVGFLVEETDEFYCVALNRSFNCNTENPFGDLMTIPKVAVTKVKRVK